MFEINSVILEGPDLAGKTSLYNEIHRHTQFKWNIQDRSSLSMVCYARQFERDSSSLRASLERDLCNLNNIMIILLPRFDVLRQRYDKRGDDVQDLASLSRLHDIFTEETTLIENFPNVLVLREECSLAENVLKVVNYISNAETMCLAQAGKWVSTFVQSGQENEYCINLRKSGKITKSTSDIMSDPLEGQYYSEILWDLENVIRKEMIGLNPYGKEQDQKSRRFYYSSNSCISSIHLMSRLSTLKCYVVFRSTNAVKNASIDLEFIEHLIHILGDKYFLKCKKFDVNIRLNSAHVLEETS